MKTVFKCKAMIPFARASQMECVFEINGSRRVLGKKRTNAFLVCLANAALSD
jgi:hypothetical protein